MRRILLSVLFLVNLGWLSPATAASQVLRMHHDMPADSALHKGVMVFKQLVEARSQGQYTVSFHDSSWLDYLRLPHSLGLSTLDEVSNHYWKGTLVEEVGLRFMDEPWRETPVIEALFQGKLDPVSLQPQTPLLPGFS